MGAPERPRPAARRATESDADAVVDVFVSAFDDDPLWSWVFADPQRRPEQLRRFWHLAVDGALRYPWVWLTADGVAAAAWIPPGGTELSAEQEATLEPLLTELLGQRASRALDLLDRFEQAHPRGEPHYYLSLLGTHERRRGEGLGLGLLTSALETIDSEHVAAYLEASNPANVALYEQHGFEVVGGFEAPDEGPVVTTMWRPSR